MSTIESISLESSVANEEPEPRPLGNEYTNHAHQDEQSTNFETALASPLGGRMRAGRLLANFALVNQQLDDWSAQAERAEAQRKKVFDFFDTVLNAQLPPDVEEAHSQYYDQAMRMEVFMQDGGGGYAECSFDHLSPEEQLFPQSMHFFGPGKAGTALERKYAEVYLHYNHSRTSADIVLYLLESENSADVGKRVDYKNWRIEGRGAGITMGYALRGGIVHDTLAELGSRFAW